MTARYHVLASDEIMASDDLQWPGCLRPVEQEEASGPGSHWWLLEDDDADEALNGKRIELVFQTKDSETRILARRPA